MTTEILTSAANGLGNITLNRPQALHALTTHIRADMIQALLAWRDDPASAPSCSITPRLLRRRACP